MYIGSPDGRTNLGPENDASLLPSTSRALSGQTVQLPPPGRAALVLFASTTCRLCASVRDDVKRLEEYLDKIDLFVLCTGSRHEVERWAAPVVRFGCVIHDHRGRLAARYRAYATPFIVAVDQAGVVRGKALVNDARGLRWAVAQALGTAPGQASTALNREESV